MYFRKREITTITTEYRFSVLFCLFLFQSFIIFLVFEWQLPNMDWKRIFQNESSHNSFVSPVSAQDFQSFLNPFLPLSALSILSVVILPLNSRYMMSSCAYYRWDSIARKRKLEMDQFSSHNPIRFLYNVNKYSQTKLQHALTQIKAIRFGSWAAFIETILLFFMLFIQFAVGIGARDTFLLDFFSNENIRLILSIQKWSFSWELLLIYWIIRKFM